MKRRIAVALAVSALAGALGSCSDDGGAGRPAELGKAQLREYCTRALRAEAFPFPRLGNQSEGEQAAAIKKYASELKEAVEAAAEAAPANISADLTTDAKALGGVAETGNLTRRGAPARAAAARAHAFNLDNCGWARVDTEAVEYSFGGIPAVVAPGIVSFEMFNRGQEPHVLELYRIKGAVAETGLQIFEGGVPDAEDLAKVTDVGSAFARPDEAGYFVRDLKPGRYVAACLISLGGEPPTTHATRGMLTEFTVT